MSKDLSILVIDDSDEFRETMLAFLKKVLPTASVIGASNGKTGIELAQSQNIDLFLIDFEMDMSGTEVIHKIREIPQYENAPFVIITAYDSLENQVDSMLSGAVSFIPKPIVFSEFSENLKTLIHNWHLD